MLYNYYIVAIFVFDSILTIEHEDSYEKRMEWNIEKVEIRY